MEAAQPGAQSSAHLDRVLHGGSLKADRKGAVAEGATVVTVSYRSTSALSAPAEVLHCSRPFAVLLVQGDGAHLEVVTVLRVTGDALDGVGQP